MKIDLQDERINQMAAQILLIIVGLVFLFTGLFKVIYSRPFIIHVRNLGILPRSLNETGASLFIQLECSVGTALVLFAFPVELIPVLIFLILLLSIVTTWGIRIGRVEDCGCYGGWLSLDLQQSLGLNAVYLVILSAVWINLDRDPPVAMWKVLAIIGVMALSNFLVRRSANAPLVDLSPLRPGWRWKQGWAELPGASTGTAHLVVFISHDCYRCKEWMAYIEHLANRTELPDPVLVFPESAAVIESPNKNIESHIIKPSLFRFLVYQTPTAVLVINNRIQDKWVGHFPEEFV